MCDPRLERVLAPVLPLLDRTIEQLEDYDWGPPTFQSSTVIGCHALRKVKLRDLATQQLRLSLSQQVGLPYIVPLALQLLWQDVLAAGDYYPGDLFSALLSIPPNHWSGRSEDVSLIYHLWARFSMSADADTLAWVEKGWEQFTGKRPPKRWLRPAKALHAPAGTTPISREHAE